MQILVLGSINMDVVSQVDRHPRSGETVKGKDFAYIPGGKGSNQAIAAHRAGGTVSMAGKIGDDAFGQNLLSFFKNEGISTEYISISQRVSTGAAFVAVDSSSENVIYVSGGANDSITSAEVEQLGITHGDIISATLETPVPAVQCLFERAREAGATIVLNAAPAILEGESLLPLLDYLIVNETELAAFAQADLPESKEAALSLMRAIRKEHDLVIVTTLGKQGAVVLTREESIEIPGRNVPAVDATAAGDCFVGCFIAGIQEGKSLREALEFANIAAAISVQRLGASSSLPTRAEIDAAL